jgi:hypothetical protein
MITDAHIHVQPWWELKPAVLETMTRGRDDVDELQKIRSDRREDLLSVREGFTPEWTGLAQVSSRGRGRRLVHVTMPRR